jgi:hypothetical protein
MNRRNFLQASAAGTGLVLTAPALVIFETGCPTSWIQTVENDLPIIVGIANSILQVITTATGSGAIAADVGKLVTESVQTLSTSLQALQDAVTAYQANTGTGLSRVIAALVASQADIKAVIQSLPAGTIAPVEMTIIVGGVGLVITILSAIQSLIPGAAPTGVTAKAISAVSKQTVVMPNAAALKTGYNSLLWLHGYESAAVK